MKGKTIEKRVLQVVEKVIGMEVKKNNDIWPPVCGGFVHQPKRPIPKKER